MIHPGDMAGKGPLGLKGAKPRRSPGVTAAPLRQAAKGQTCTCDAGREARHRLIIAPRLSPGGGNLTTNGASDG